jgi:hypothetical protein
MNPEQTSAASRKRWTPLVLLTAPAVLLLGACSTDAQSNEPSYAPRAEAPRVTAPPVTQPRSVPPQPRYVPPVRQPRYVPPAYPQRLPSPIVPDGGSGYDYADDVQVQLEDLESQLEDAQMDTDDMQSQLDDLGYEE